MSMMFFLRASFCRVSCFRSRHHAGLGAISGEGLAIDALSAHRPCHYVEGFDIADLQYDTIALVALMLLAMTIAVRASAAPGLRQKS